MQKDIEVEVRGPLTEVQYRQALSFLKENGSFVESKNRVLLDYSTMLPEEGVAGRTRDIRLRVTNGKPEIITKLGKWGGEEHRRELSIKTEVGSFDTLVETYAVLGYTKAMLCVRQTEVFDYKDVEFALVTVPGHSFYFEAERVVTGSEDVTEVKEHLNSICTELGLTLFTDQTFYDYIEMLNREANEEFDFEKMYSPEYFKNRFRL